MLTYIYKLRGGIEAEEEKQQNKCQKNINIYQKIHVKGKI